MIEPAPCDRAAWRGAAARRARLAGRPARDARRRDPGPRPARGLLLLVLDVDDFRRFNAERGYAAGDLLLADLGGRLAGLGRAFALGADAFALVLDGSPEELWRRGAAALWSLDPAAGALGPALLVRRRRPRRPARPTRSPRSSSPRTGWPTSATAPRRSPSATASSSSRSSAPSSRRPPSTRSTSRELAAGVAARLGVDPLDRALVRRAAELHDVGKIAIDPAIVAKPGPLDDAEWAQMRRHTIIGDELLVAAPPLRAVAPLVRASHERWDGGGYPDGAAGADDPARRAGSSRRATPTTR